MSILNITQNFEIVETTKEEAEILNSLKGDYSANCEMSWQDRNFLNSLILRKKPKKLLEIGVLRGGSSVIMLNAIKNTEGAHLYSHDYLENCYGIAGKKSGFVLDYYPELKKNNTLFLGGLVLNHLDKIGDNIDFVFIDTMHTNPGEILDVIMILPYLSTNTTIVFHDVNMHLLYEDSNITNNLLMSVLRGKKLTPSFNPHMDINEYMTNIGAVELENNQKEHIWELFNILNLKWEYMPSPKDIIQLKMFIQKHYGEYFYEYFKKIVEIQKDRTKIKRK